MNRFFLPPLLAAGLVAGMLACWRGVSAQGVAPEGAVRVNPGDGQEMLLVPAGEFIMGSDEGEADERPAHKVFLPAYTIGKTAVTVGQYRKFLRETGYRSEGVWNTRAEDERLPVVGVSWNDAAAYCKWAGARLPTEAEWEKAARGTDGRRYPWGNEWDPRKLNGWGVVDGFYDIAPVGSFPQGASPYGCLDMAGNAWEWCADWYDANAYTSPVPQRAEPPTRTPYHVLRGGSYYTFGAGAFRSSFRGCVVFNPSTRIYPYPGSYRYDDFGFRIACSTGP